MNPMILFLIQLLIRVGRETWAQLLKMYGTMEELMSEASFGMWISYCGYDIEGLKSYYEYHKKCLKALILFANPYFVYAFYPELYEKDTFFREFIDGDPLLHEIFLNCEQMRKENKVSDNLPEWVKDFISNPLFSWMTPVLALLYQNIYTFFEEYTNFFISMWIKSQEKPQDFFNEVMNQLTTSTFPKIANLPTTSVIMKCNPLLIMEMPTIIGHAHASTAYKYVLETMTTPKFDKKFYTELQARLYFDDKVMAWGRPNEDGEVVFELPKQRVLDNPAQLEIISFLGLTAMRGGPLFVESQLYVWDTRTYIDSNDPVYTRWVNLNNGWVEVCFEDEKGLRYCDFDFNDAFFRFRFWGDKMYWEVWNGEHSFTHSYFINGVKICDLPPRSQETKVKVAEGYLDLNTMEVVITWKA